MELLASISRPTCSGRFVCAAKFITCLGGCLLSMILNCSCFRSRTNFPFLSTTVKITFTSSVRTRTVGSVLFSLADGSPAGAGLGVDTGCCADATTQAIANRRQKDRDCLRVIRVLLNHSIILQL